MGRWLLCDAFVLTAQIKKANTIAKINFIKNKEKL